MFERIKAAWKLQVIQLNINSNLLSMNSIYSSTWLGKNYTISLNTLIYLRYILWRLDFQQLNKNVLCLRVWLGFIAYQPLLVI